MDSMKKYISSVVQAIPPSGIRKFFDLVSQTEGIISLGVGEPDFVTPWHIIESAVQSLENGYTMYTSNSGLPELREEIAAYEKSRIGVEYDPEKEILVTVGVSEGVDITLRALLNPGDEVLIPEPSYVCYGPDTAMASGIPVPVQTFARDEYRLKAEELEKKITPRSKVLILPYPCNPTGGIMEREDLAQLVDLIIKNDLIVISDEIYAELTYGIRHASITEFPGMRDRTIVLNGFSKAFAMTGWRIAYACGHRDLIGALTKIHQYTIMCAPTMAQKAALEALRNGNEEMRKMIADYNMRRQLLVNGLRGIGLDCFEPRGAFYCFPSIVRSGLTSEVFSERLLFEENVAVVPGTAFGVHGEGHVRCCYAASVNHIEEALVRIDRFLKRVSP